MKPVNINVNDKSFHDVILSLMPLSYKFLENFRIQVTFK